MRTLTAAAADAGFHATERVSTTDVRHADRRVPSVLTARLRAAWPGWRDAVAATLLAATTWHLVGHDGGIGARDLAPVLVVALVALAACWPQVRAASRPVQVLAAGWAASPLVAVAFASVRAGMTRPLMVASLAVPVWFATTRIWRRGWGPAFLLALLAAAGLRSFYGTALAWWGGGGASGTQWLALSWHNQSGALAGAFGLVGLSVALLQTGRVRALGVVVAATGLAGAWLSGSRGVVIILVVAVMLVLAAAVVTAGWHRIAAATAVVAVATGLLVVGLTGFGEDGAGSQPITARDQDAAGNLQARFGHWEAAVAMAADAPVFGQGLGSYRWTSLERYPADTNLTNTAHNEYLEALGERGMVGAAPIWIAAVALAWLALASVRRRVSTDPARRTGQVAAIGVVALLGLHAGMDFDWRYPVLLALLVGAGAILHTEARGVARRRQGPGLLAGTTAFVAGLGLLAGMAVAVPQWRGTAEPWQLSGALLTAMADSEAGEFNSARAALAEAEMWNPGAWSLGPVTAIVDHRAGAIDDAELIATVEGPRGASHVDQIAVAARLVDAGEMDAAEKVLADTRESLEAHAAWGYAGLAPAVATLQVRIALFTDRCAGAESMWQDLQPWLAQAGADLEATWQSWEAADTGCVLTTPPVG